MQFGRISLAGFRRCRVAQARLEVRNQCSSILAAHARRAQAIFHTAHGGSFPIRVAGVGIVGAVTVSGLPQAQDHALVVEGLRDFLAG